MAEDAVEAWMDEDFGQRTDPGSVGCSNELGRAEFVDRWRSLASKEERDEAEVPEVHPFEEDDSVEEPLPLAVVEKDLPSGLFGFTRRDSSHVVVNRNLYRVDRDRTVRHEKAHHRFPKDELTIRYINGDPEVRNTLSFQANNPGRLGRGSRGVSRTGGIAAYAGRGSGSDYSPFSDDYL